MIKSIAVFGINRTYGSVLAVKLAAQPFRILVLSEEFDDCPSLFLDYPDADIQVLNCPAQTGWEADIIVINASAQNQLKLVGSIREFVTKKIVLNISEIGGEDILNDEYGSDQDALDETKQLLKQAGFVNASFELSESN